MFRFNVFNLLHHGEPVDPVLFAWLQHKIDSILTLGPGAAVLIFGAIIVLIPILILVAFWRNTSSG
jgi:hypothetical protein